MSARGRSKAGTNRFRGLKTAALGAGLIASACAVAVALALPQAWWLTWLALLPLFHSIRVQRPLPAMLSGGLWGLCLFVFSVMAVETAVPHTARSLGLLVAVPAVYAYVAALLTRHIGFVPLAIAYGWLGVEFGLTPLGLRHGLLASAQGDGVLVGSIGHMLGYVFVALLIAGLNASVLGVLSKARLTTCGQRSAQGLPEAGLRAPPSHGFQHVRWLVLKELHPRAPPILLPTTRQPVAGNGRHFATPMDGSRTHQSRGSYRKTAAKLAVVSIFGALRNDRQPLGERGRDPR